MDLLVPTISICAHGRFQQHLNLNHICSFDAHHYLFPEDLHILFLYLYNDADPETPLFDREDVKRCYDQAHGRET